MAILLRSPIGLKIRNMKYLITIVLLVLGLTAFGQSKQDSFPYTSVTEIAETNHIFLKDEPIDSKEFPTRVYGDSMLLDKGEYLLNGKKVFVPKDLKRGDKTFVINNIMVKYWIKKEEK